MVGLGEYDRKARIYPGLLAIPPISVLVVTLGLKKYPAFAVAGGVVAGAIGVYVLALVVGYFGKKPEPDLWKSWGGRDTTRLLRLREPSSNPVEQGHWRSALQAVTQIELLDADSEAENPTLADQTIEAAVNRILPLGRGDKRYPLAFAENIGYGFERNLWGIRWIGRLIATLSLITLAALFVFGPVRVGGTNVSAGALIAGLVVDAFFLLGWITGPSLRRVRFRSDRYARRLFEAVVSESQSSATSGGTKDGTPGGRS